MVAEWGERCVCADWVYSGRDDFMMMTGCEVDGVGEIQLAWVCWFLLGVRSRLVSLKEQGSLFSFFFFLTSIAFDGVAELCHVLTGWWRMT